jgi:hypothetical protein
MCLTIRTLRTVYRMFPDSFLSIIMDKMDSYKTSMPRVNTKSKKSGRKYFKQFVNGVLVHGLQWYTFLGHDAYGMRGWADLQIECLLRAVVEIDEDYRILGKSLPRILYLQLDNASDNKNKYMMAFTEHLVNVGVFDKVEIGFLVVGHTHEDIDQRFSVLSKHLNLFDAVTPSQWAQRVTDAFSGPGSGAQYEGLPRIRTVHSIYGYSSWLKPYISSDYKGTSGARLFEFTRDSGTGRCVQRWKHYSSSVEWWPHGRDGEIGGGGGFPQPALALDCPYNADSVPQLRELALLEPGKLKEIFKCVMRFVAG